MSLWTEKELRGAIKSAKATRTHLSRALISDTASTAALELLRARINEDLTTLRRLLIAEHKNLENQRERREETQAQVR